MGTKNVREVALNILVQVGESGGFSHIIINQAINKHKMKSQDNALLTEIVYGTLQRKLTLKYYTDHFVKRKINPWVKWLIYLSIYQMVYLERVPDHAVINEAVNIAKRKGHRGISGLVNGVLRNVQRNGVPSFEVIDDPVEQLAIKTSHPYWLVERWTDMYGFEITESMCFSNLESKKLSVRIQPLKNSINQVESILEGEGIETKRSTLSAQGLTVITGNPLQSQLFPSAITIQDETSMLVAEMLNPKPGMTVLDACSAPGGKTTHIAEKMENQGIVMAYDLHEKKVNLVEEKANDLDLSIIQAKPYDSRLLSEIHENESFDRILLDAPCSGLGVLRSKPDIKYHKQKKDIVELAKVQRQLLDSVLPLLKKDGYLVYSTCTVDRHENEDQIIKLLQDYPDLTVDQDFFNELPQSCQGLSGITEYGIQIFPQDFNADGFFITRLIKL